MLSLNLSRVEKSLLLQSLAVIILVSSLLGFEFRVVLRLAL